MNNERTSKRVAKIAAKVRRRKSVDDDFLFDWTPICTVVFDWTVGELVGELKALAASCLTQAPDKPKQANKAKPTKK